MPAENCLRGEQLWTVDDPAGIEGFATRPSVNHGESVGLKVNSTTTSAYNVQILRTGYYDGRGAREIGMIRNVPAPDAAGVRFRRRRRACSTARTGPRTRSVTTTAAWPSGVYMLNLIPRDAPGHTATTVLVVRDDQRPSDLLYGVPDTTYQAYNDWGGRSLYAFNSTPDPQATKVSYNRPYQRRTPTSASRTGT